MRIDDELVEAFIDSWAPDWRSNLTLTEFAQAIDRARAALSAALTEPRVLRMAAEITGDDSLSAAADRLEKEQRRKERRRG